MNYTIVFFLGVVFGISALKLWYEPRKQGLEVHLFEARDARDLAEGKLIAYERMAERIHAYCRDLSDGENVRLTGYEPWEAWLELDGALAELRRAIADSADDVQEGER